MGGDPPTIVKCPICSHGKLSIVADYYFEYPALIVLLDLLLLREKAFVHVVYNVQLGKRPFQLGVLALIADTFFTWRQHEKWEISIFDEISSIGNLYHIQSTFYYYLFKSLVHHVIQIIILLSSDQFIFKIK